MVECSHVSKFTEGSWQGSFTVNAERAVQTLPEKCFDRIPLRPEFACKFADWFSSVFQSLQMHFCVFCNLADSSSIKTNQEIVIFAAKTNIQTCSYLGPGILEKTKETIAI